MPIDPSISSRINEVVESHASRLIEIRHQLHANPGIAFQESFASDLVVDELNTLNIPNTKPAGDTGVVAWLLPLNNRQGRNDSMALRADLDALPIEEKTELTYASQTPGCMHACGHDGHTAILLGVAHVLTDLRKELPCPVKLIFQPAEETGQGAQQMIDAGALGKSVGGFAVDRIFGIHNWPGLAAGTVALREGAMMAGAEWFEIEVTGRGGHGAMPQDTRDALTAAVQIAGSLHTLISRNLHPQEPAALTLGSFQAGQSHNAIPQKAFLRGNIRYFKSETRELLMNRIDEVATPTARAMGCEASTKYRTIAPPLENDAASVEIMHNAADEMGLAAVQLPKPSMATEDFARYTGRVSGAFAFIGADEPGKTDMGEHRGLHSPHYDFNDAIIGAAVRLLSAIPWAM